MPGRLLARSASTLCRVQALQAARDAPRSVATPTRMHPGKRAPRARDRQSPRAGFYMMPRERKSPRKGKKECISQESSPGHADGNDVFYHFTTAAVTVCRPACRVALCRAARSSKRQARSRDALRGRSIAAAARSLRSRTDAATRAGAILRSQMRCPAARGRTVAARSRGSPDVREGAQTTSTPGIEK